MNPVPVTSVTKSTVVPSRNSALCGSMKTSKLCLASLVLATLLLAAPDAAEADIVIEHEFNTKPIHQGYIEPQASLANYTEGGFAEVWTGTQIPRFVQANIERLTGIPAEKITVVQGDSDRIV